MALVHQKDSSPYPPLLLPLFADIVALKSPISFPYCEKLALRCACGSVNWHWKGRVAGFHSWECTACHLSYGFRPTVDYRSAPVQ